VEERIMAGYYDRDRNPNGAFGSSATAAGTMNHSYPHVGNTAEYQSSGYPFFQTITIDGGVYPNADNPAADITLANGDIISIEFPYVSRWIMMTAHKTNSKIANDKAFVGMSETGVASGASSFVDLAFVDGVRLEMKASKLYFRIADVGSIDHIEIIAGLTGVPSSQFTVETSGGTNVGIETAATVLVEYDKP
jgi:hypothetical protein